MSMTFEASSSVTLLFDFWDVHGPGGMLLSVFVVFLFTVFYELLKVWKVYLGERPQDQCSAPPPVVSFPIPAPTCTPSGPCFPSSPPACFSPPPEYHESTSVLASTPSDSSLNPSDVASIPVASSDINSWLMHGLQTLLHVLQVALGYMLMLCVMTYNVWIFLGVIVGSVLGYFLAFPLLGKV